MNLLPGPSSTPRRVLMWSISLMALALALLVLGAALGSTGLLSLTHSTADPLASRIVWEIRLPRTTGAWSAGALLGLAGALAQGLFRNPLADPFLLGSASGASLGIAVALVGLGGLGEAGMGQAWLARLGLSGAGFVGAVAGVAMTLLLARGVQHTLRLLLAGVIVGVVLGAAKDGLMLAAPETLQAMQSFTLGTTAFVGWPGTALMALVWLLCTAIALGFARMLDGLSLGESTALSLGLPLATTRLVLIAVLALATGTAVAQTGLIAFVGLAAPHVVRARLKTGQGALLWLSSLMGGVLLMAADVLARALIAPQELPVGVLTAVLGGGYLMWLMHRGQAGQRASR
jgi:iron complex transport system permease protein